MKILNMKTIVMVANDGLSPEELDNIVQVMFIEFDYDFLKLMMSFLLFCYIERIFALEQEVQNELLH